MSANKASLVKEIVEERVKIINQLKISFFLVPSVFVVYWPCAQQHFTEFHWQTVAKFQIRIRRNRWRMISTLVWRKGSNFDCYQHGTNLTYFTTYHKFSEICNWIIQLHDETIANFQTKIHKGYRVSLCTKEKGGMYKLFFFASVFNFINITN